MKWHIGCSGFHYKDWKEVFYPAGLPQRRWFEYYSTQFDTLELNVTFYRFPQLKSLQQWYSVSPAHFRFAVKAPRLITHYKQFNDCESLLNDFYATTTEGLQEKLGAVLFQLPPAMNYTAERLDRILQGMQPRLNNVVEFRHASWWNKEVITSLRKKSIIFCGISHPSLPTEAIVNNSVAYYRFHGIPKLYYSSYEEKVLQQVADAIQGNQTVKQAYIYFNNTATMAAINNAAWLKSYIGPLLTGDRKGKNKILL